MLPQSEGGGTGHAFPVILKSQNREGKLQLVAECTDRAYFDADAAGAAALLLRSEEHTSELQSLMRISYAVFCLKKKQQTDARHNIVECMTSSQKTQAMDNKHE